VRLYERDGAFMGSPSGAGAALCVRAAVRSDGRGRIREIVTPVRSAMRKKRISRMWERDAVRSAARATLPARRVKRGARRPPGPAQHATPSGRRIARRRGEDQDQPGGSATHSPPLLPPPARGGRLPPLGSSPAKSGPAVSGVAKADLPIPASPKRPGIIQTSQKLADFPLFTFLDYTGPLL
jgi:hypothetical protein